MHTELLNAFWFFLGLAIGGSTTYLVAIIRNGYSKDRECEEIRAFNKKFGFLEFSYPGLLTMRLMMERLECLMEELSETREAAVRLDLVEVFDGLIDIVYFAKGTAVMMGLPWRDGWKEVHRSNMEKVRGMNKRGHKVDVKKPPGWRPPDLRAALSRTGWPYLGSDTRLRDNQ